MNYSLLLHDLLEDAKRKTQYKALGKPFSILAFLSVIPFFLTTLFFLISYAILLFLYGACSASIRHLELWVKQQKENVMHATEAVLYFTVMPFLFFCNILLSFFSFWFYIIWFFLECNLYVLTLGGIRWQPLLSENVYSTKEVKVSTTKRFSAILFCYVCSFLFFFSVGFWILSLLIKNDGDIVTMQQLFANAHFLLTPIVVLCVFRSKFCDNEQESTPAVATKKEKRTLFISLAVLLGVLVLLFPIFFFAYDYTPKYIYEEAEDGCYIFVGFREDYIYDETTFEVPETYRGKNVTEIAAGAFKNQSMLTNIKIPSSVTKIGFGAFEGCNSLQSLTLPFVGASMNDTKALSYLFSSSFYSNSALNVPSSLKQVNVTSATVIADYTFFGCSTLTTVTLPSTLTQIGGYAFDSCSALQSITIPNSVTSIGAGAFSGCSSLQSITIPDSVTQISEYAFDSCSALQSITIPNSVTRIGANAFSGCLALNKVIFENTVGWKRSSSSLASSALSDPSTAATYLTKSYSGYTWTRS